MRRIKLLLVSTLVTVMAYTSLFGQDYCIKNVVKAEEVTDAVSNESILGDINQDGMLGLDDGQLILKAALHMVSLDESVSTVADIDSDGNIYLRDADSFLKQITGMEAGTLNITDAPIKKMENMPSITTRAVLIDDHRVKYTISMQENRAISMFDYGIVYDTEVFELVSMNWREDWERAFDNGSGIMRNNHTDYDSIAIVGINVEPFSWSGGKIYEMIFEIKEGKNFTEAKPFMTVSNASFYKGEFTDIEDNADNALSADIIDIRDFVLQNEMLVSYTGDDREVVIPDEVTHIGSFAFENNTTITDVIIPTGVSVIGDGAFKGCVNLSDITFPTTVIGIGYEAFSGTAWFREKQDEDFVIIDEFLLDVNNCNKDITVPTGVAVIADHAFENCDGIENIIIPEGVRSIGDCAFNGCTNLKTVTIPKSVEYIFDMGNELQNVIIKGYKGTEAEIYAQEGGMKFIALDENELNQKITFFDIDGKEGIDLNDVQAILKRALKITPSDVAYTLADAKKCLRIALKIEVLE